MLPGSVCFPLIFKSINSIRSNTFDIVRKKWRNIKNKRKKRKAATVNGSGARYIIVNGVLQSSSPDDLESNELPETPTSPLMNDRVTKASNAKRNTGSPAGSPSMSPLSPSYDQYHDFYKKLTKENKAKRKEEKRHDSAILIQKWWKGRKARQNFKQHAVDFRISYLA